MAASKTIKNRIKATKNIGQITKAMEAVSAVKMRKSEAAAVSNRPYALSALEVLKNVRAALTDEEAAQSDLVNERTVSRVCLVIISSDKGLAGAFNTNVFRRATEFIKTATTPVDIVAVGKKSLDFVKRHGISAIAEFQGIGDVATLEETLPIARFLHERYVSKQCDQVSIISTHFISSMKQSIVTRKVLPVTVDALADIAQHIMPEHGLYSKDTQEIDMALSKHPHDYTFEPSAREVLEKLIPDLVNVEIHQSILEANAAEHSSRMIAMRSASDNASDLLTSLRMAYNKVRQAQITKELTEITGGAEALNH